MKTFPSKGECGVGSRVEYINTGYRGLTPRAQRNPAGRNPRFVPQAQHQIDADEGAAPMRHQAVGAAYDFRRLSLSVKASQHDRIQGLNSQGDVIDPVGAENIHFIVCDSDGGNFHAYVRHRIHWKIPTHKIKNGLQPGIRHKRWCSSSKIKGREGNTSEYLRKGRQLCAQ